MRLETSPQSANEWKEKLQYLIVYVSFAKDSSISLNTSYAVK